MLYIFMNQNNIYLLWGVVTKEDKNTYRSTIDILTDLSKLFNKAIKECDNENHQTGQA